jgi:hypothetical protein
VLAFPGEDERFLPCIRADGRVESCLFCIRGEIIGYLTPYAELPLAEKLPVALL